MTASVRGRPLEDKLTYVMHVAVNKISHGVKFSRRNKITGEISLE